MTPAELHRLLVAPAIIVVDLAAAALLALQRALLVEHPLLDAPHPTEHPPVRRRARLLFRHAQRLRRALRAYRRLVRRPRSPFRRPAVLIAIPVAPHSSRSEPPQTSRRRSPLASIDPRTLAMILRGVAK